MTTRVRSLPALLGLAALISLAPQAVRAEGPAPASRLTPEQREKLFPEQKALWLKHQRDRLSGLKAAERCVNDAKTARAFQQCLRRERQANMTLKRNHWSEMRSLYARYGITLPEKPQKPEARGREDGGWSA